MDRSHSLRFVTSLAIMFLVLVSTAAMAQTNAVPFANQPLVPAAAAPGSGAFTLTVNGTGFVSGAVVNWNGSPRTTTFVSSSSLQASITAADVASKGTATVTVVNPAPGGGASNFVLFPVREPLASVAAAVDNKFSSAASGNVVIAADFTNNGKQDLVVAVNNSDAGTATLYFYPGNGAGSFGTPITSSATIPVAFMFTGDFNNDGKLDILVGDGATDFASQAAIFLGDGHGHFSQQPLSDNMGDFGQPVAVADFNGDGNLDMVYYGEAEGYASFFVVLGNGNGTFQTVNRANEIQNIGNPGVAVGDFNGDGILDLAVGSNQSIGANSPVQIFLGNGDGTFTAGATYASAGENTMAAADLNGDGNLDLIFTAAAGNYGLNGLCVMLGNGDGTFGTPNCLGSATEAGIQLGDFNGDGKLDIAANFGSVYLGNGNGTFQNPISLAYVAAGSQGAALGIADFNNDGELDFAYPVYNINTYEAATVALQTTLSISTASLSFGTHKIGTESKTQTITLTNIGTTRLDISSITLTGADPGDFVEQGKCASGIKPGGTCTLQVAFKPAADGTRTASLSIAYGGALGSPQSVALSGYGY
jgi:hypothetical protein